LKVESGEFVKNIVDEGVVIMLKSVTLKSVTQICVILKR